MDKYDRIIMQLTSKGIKFSKGLTEQEVVDIETLYDIMFPNELKKLYYRSLPVSSGFYNWRDKNRNNVELLMNVLANPLKGITEDLRDGFFWCDIWGDRPSKFEEANKIMLTHYDTAPKLIPIYSHRYIPAVSDAAKVPIFSVHGTDIIYYGEDLISYFEIESGLKKYSEIDYSKCAFVPFWSDLL